MNWITKLFKRTPAINLDGVPGGKKILKSGRKYDWEFLEHQPNVKMISFTKRGDRINIYYTTWTVASVINHPKGRKQMFRKHCTFDMIEEIFENPRIHTGRGYAKK